MTSNCTAVILAGGQGLRLGKLGSLLPKTMLNLYDFPLCIHILEYLRESGFCEVIISTNNEFYSLINKFIERYKATCDLAQEIDVQVLENPQHIYGPLPALYNVGHSLRTEYVLMCLGDIFYLNNPFCEFDREMHQQSVYLGVTQISTSSHYKKGGIVYTKDHKVTSVVKGTTLQNLESGSANALLWGGVAYFPLAVIEHLKPFLDQVDLNSSLEDFFEFCIHCGNDVSTILCSDFVNINSVDDLLLATIYRAKQKAKSEVLMNFINILGS